MKSAATTAWPERVIVDGREIPVVIDPMLPDHAGICEWNNEALVRRATLLYDLGWRLARV